LVLFLFSFFATLQFSTRLHFVTATMAI